MRAIAYVGPNSRTSSTIMGFASDVGLNPTNAADTRLEASSQGANTRGVAEKTATFVPDPKASQLEFHVGLGWGGPVISYRYSRVQ